MIEKSAQPTGIVTADLKRITLLMASIAFPLDSCDGSHHSVPYAWIFCHFKISPFTCFGCLMILLRMNDLYPAVVLLVFRSKLLRTPLNHC
jgi:hypothetical protein